MQTEAKTNVDIRAKITSSDFPVLNLGKSLAFLQSESIKKCTLIKVLFKIHYKKQNGRNFNHCQYLSNDKD